MSSDPESLPEEMSAIDIKSLGCQALPSVIAMLQMSAKPWAQLMATLLTAVEKNLCKPTPEIFGAEGIDAETLESIQDFCEEMRAKCNC